MNYDEDQVIVAKANRKREKRSIKRNDERSWRREVEKELINA